MSRLDEYLEMVDAGASEFNKYKKDVLKKLKKLALAGRIIVFKNTCLNSGHLLKKSLF